MGATESKTSIDVVNTSIINVILNAAQNCSGFIKADQNISHTGLGFFTGAKQKTYLSANCIQQVTIDDKLITEMANSIVQNGRAENTGFLPAYAGTNAEINVKNFLHTNLQRDFHQRCVASVKATQTVSFGGVQIGVYDEQDVRALQNCMSTSLNKMGIAQGITVGINQQSQAVSASPFSLTGLFGDLSGIAWYVVLFIVVIIAAQFLLPLINRSMEASSPRLASPASEPAIANPQAATITAPAS